MGGEGGAKYAKYITIVKILEGQDCCPLVFLSCGPANNAVTISLAS